MKKLLNPIEKVILQKSRNKKNIEYALQEWRFSDVDANLQFDVKVST
jgi:hypothetical protein|tara:strand:+ start:454 stop:594 length:141 start_codon:yes stop_codon:yes gene_type:complete